MNKRTREGTRRLLGKRAQTGAEAVRHSGSTWSDPTGCSTHQRAFRAPPCRHPRPNRFPRCSCFHWTLEKARQLRALPAGQAASLAHARIRQWPSHHDQRPYVVEPSPLMRLDGGTPARRSQTARSVSPDAMRDDPERQAASGAGLSVLEPTAAARDGSRSVTTQIRSVTNTSL